MTLVINQLKSGLTIKLNDVPFMVISVDHVKPGKGSAFARTKLRNLRLGTVIERTFKSSEKLDEAYIEQRKMQYSYQSGEHFHFLDQDTFEDLSIEKSHLGNVAKLIKDNITVNAYFFEGELVNVDLPATVEYKIIETEPGFKGDTAKASYKPATIETGAIIQVPLFVKTGDVIKLDTRTGEYGGRV